MTGARVYGVRHHVFGSTPSGFTTLWSSPGLEASAIRELEDHSVYSLPGEPKNQLEARVKRTCYPIGDDVVVGRAIHLVGIDRTGRPGNYVGHNIVFKRSDVDSDYLSPLDLLAAVEAAGCLLSSVPSDIPPALTAGVTLESSRPAGLEVDSGVLSAAISYCLAWEAERLPMVVLGSEREFSSVVGSALRLVPRSLAWQLPVDSYAYECDWRCSAIAGYPVDPVFSADARVWDLRIDVTSSTAEWREGSRVEPLAEYLTETRAEPEAAKQAFLRCLECARESAWEACARQLPGLSQPAAALLVRGYHDGLVGFLATSEDGDLLAALAPALPDPDLVTLAQSAAFQAVVWTEHGRARALELALSTDCEALPLLAWIVGDHRLVEELLAVGHGASDPSASSRIVRLCDAMAEPRPDTDPDTEERLFEAAERASTEGWLSAEQAVKIVSAVRRLPRGAEAQRLRRYAVRDTLGDATAVAELLEDPPAVGLAYSGDGPHQEWMTRLQAAAKGHVSEESCTD